MYIVVYMVRDYGYAMDIPAIINFKTTATKTPFSKMSFTYVSCTTTVYTY
jgi:hypothetical protein